MAPSPDRTRENPADIDDVDRDRRFDDRLADLSHSLREGRRCHCLATDVEADAERVGGLAGSEQQGGYVARVGAELRGKAELRMVRADPDAHEQVEVARRNAVLRGCADDLVQLVDGVEAERLHAMFEIGFGDGFLGLHRVHEALHRLGQRVADEADLADGRDIIMGDSGVPQNPEEVGRRVRLDRIERPARELLDEVASGSVGCMRTQERNRLDRAQLGDSGSASAAQRGGR